MPRMIATTPTVARRLRRIHELLFSLNLAWIVIWPEGALTPARWMYSSSFVQYLYWHTRHVEPQAVLEQVEPLRSGGVCRKGNAPYVC